MRRFAAAMCWVMATAAAHAAPGWTVHDEWRGEFASRGIAQGTALVYDEAADTYHVYDRQRAETGFSPASTFKLFNALVGLETGAVRDEHEVIAWDGTDRGRAEWNRDTDLASGMRYSTVWFYQAMARRIGLARMQEWVDKAGYGNRDLGGGVDRFWLTGGLRITALQEIEFLRRLAAGTLPFSARSQEIVRRIARIDADDVPGTLRGKTGWSETSIGWFVGWVEQEGRRWFVAVNMQFGKDASVARDASKRLAIAKAVLRKTRAP